MNCIPLDAVMWHVVLVGQLNATKKLTTVPLKIGNDALRPGSALPILTSNMKNVTDGNVSISTIAKETGMRGNVKENVLRTTSVSALDSESDMLKRSRRKKRWQD